MVLGCEIFWGFSDVEEGVVELDYEGCCLVVDMVVEFWNGCVGFVNVDGFLFILDIVVKGFDE